MLSVLIFDSWPKKNTDFSMSNAQTTYLKSNTSWKYKVWQVNNSSVLICVCCIKNAYLLIMQSSNFVLQKAISKKS